EADRVVGTLVDGRRHDEPLRFRSAIAGRCRARRADYEREPIGRNSARQSILHQGEQLLRLARRHVAAVALRPLLLTITRGLDLPRELLARVPQLRHRSSQAVDFATQIPNLLLREGRSGFVGVISGEEKRPQDEHPFQNGETTPSALAQSTLVETERHPCSFPPRSVWQAGRQTVRRTPFCVNSPVSATPGAVRRRPALVRTIYRSATSGRYGLAARSVARPSGGGALSGAGEVGDRSAGGAVCTVSGWSACVSLDNRSLVTCCSSTRAPSISFSVRCCSLMAVRSRR